MEIFGGSHFLESFGSPTNMVESLSLKEIVRISMNYLIGDNATNPYICVGDERRVMTGP